MSDPVRELSNFAASVVERAEKAGATAAEVYARHGLETEIQVRNGEIDQLQEGSPKSVGIRLWTGERSASTYATDFSHDAVERLIVDSLALAALTDPVPEAALVDAEHLATSIPVLSLSDATLRDVPAAEKLSIARRCEAAALDHDPRITFSAGASYSDLSMAHVLANSHGFCAGFEATYVAFHTEVIADDADGKKRNGSWFTLGRFQDQLGAAEEIGRIAGERAVRQLGAGPIPTRKLPVVFDPRTGSALIGLLFSVLTGDPIYKRASYLSDQIGQQIGSSLLTLIDDPLRDRAIGARPFDGEGLAGRRTTFVDGGVLQTYALNSYSARKLGLSPTGHSSRPASGAPGETSTHLYLDVGDRTPEAVIADVEYGLYCESMMGFGFNPVTGDFSRGAQGHLIENGKITRPVSEVTLSANFRDIWTRLDAVANDLVHDRSTCCPTFRIAEMTLGGS